VAYDQSGLPLGFLSVGAVRSCDDMIPYLSEYRLVSDVNTPQVALNQDNHNIFMYVHTKSRGKGVAHKLMECVLSQHKIEQKQRMRYHFEADNEASRIFFERFLKNSYVFNTNDKNISVDKYAKESYGKLREVCYVLGHKLTTTIGDTSIDR